MKPPKKADVLAVLKHLAARGGKARAAKVSAERLSEIGKMGAAARWKKAKPGNSGR